MENKTSSNNLAFLSPYMSIRSEHLSKRDVINIKLSLGFKIGVACLLASIAMVLLDIVLFIILGMNSDFNIASVYGFNALLALIVSSFGAIMCIILEVISLKTKNETVKTRCCRYGHLILFVALAAQMILSMHADSSKGFLSATESVSASIMILAILMLIQPVFWTEAIILDVAVSGSL